MVASRLPDKLVQSQIRRSPATTRILWTNRTTKRSATCFPVDKGASCGQWWT